MVRSDFSKLVFGSFVDACVAFRTLPVRVFQQEATLLDRVLLPVEKSSTSKRDSAAGGYDLAALRRIFSWF